tara:strand:+ start:13250 stop:13612 length:363 start_codon:yes stop_codon:yes gene_type:complete
MKVKSFKELIVWQKAMDLSEEVYRLSQVFPNHELYALTNQIRRAVVSVPSNIAEGQARSSTADFRQYLSIARGSLAEVETQLLLAIRFNYLSETDTTQAFDLIAQTGKMLNTLRKRVVSG